jgi:hypothetical protein
MAGNVLLDIFPGMNAFDEKGLTRLIQDTQSGKINCQFRRLLTRAPSLSVPYFSRAKEAKLWMKIIGRNGCSSSYFLSKQYILQTTMYSIRTVLAQPWGNQAYRNSDNFMRTGFIVELVQFSKKICIVPRQDGMWKPLSHCMAGCSKSFPGVLNRPKKSYI